MDRELCQCGAQITVGNECWRCYNIRTGIEASHRKMLDDELRRIGFERQPGESRHDHANRCRDYLRERHSKTARMVRA